MKSLRPAHVRTMSLARLVDGLGLTGATDSTVAISDIFIDSRHANPGGRWVAVPGAKVQGASSAASALAAGVAAIVTDPAGSELLPPTMTPVVISPEPRRDAGLLAARLFNHPASRVLTMGVTGTNGKTTTVALLEAALAGTGRKVGTIGTIGFRLGGQELCSSRTTVTTPESPDLQALLAVMADGGAEAVALEVSSHAMAQERVTGMVLDVAGFLNLGHDHLEFHGDEESYFEAKASLFTPAHTRIAVCWVDDPHGARIAERARAAGVGVVTVGTGDGVDARLSGWEPVRPMGGRANLCLRGSDVSVEITLPGQHNMIDAVMALVMADSVGIPATDVLPGLRQAQVPGRMQLIDLPGEAPSVVIDFAHTPQAVIASLEALAQSFEHVIVVLGCGGDRDREKRPVMGAAAALRSDVLVVTDDNPRSEDPAAIRREMLAGITGGSGVVVEVADRRAAIEHALCHATAGSVVAILGKGHERGQQVGQEVLDFDDAVEARRAWMKTMEGQR